MCEQLGSAMQWGQARSPVEFDSKGKVARACSVREGTWQRGSASRKTKTRGKGVRLRGYECYALEIGFRFSQGFSRNSLFIKMIKPAPSQTKLRNFQLLSIQTAQKMSRSTISQFSLKKPVLHFSSQPDLDRMNHWEL